MQGYNGWWKLFYVLDLEACIRMHVLMPAPCRSIVEAASQCQKTYFTEEIFIEEMNRVAKIKYGS